jgi:hypothetical protein
MREPDETYIVRVRSDEGDAVVEEVRSREQMHVRDLTQLGELITARLRRRRRLVAEPPDADGEPSGADG